jgi:hypothetical protein
MQNLSKQLFYQRKWLRRLKPQPMHGSDKTLCKCDASLSRPSRVLFLMHL